MKLWSLILLIGVIFHHRTTATKFQRGNYLVTIEDGVLVDIEKMEDVLDLSDLGINQIKSRVFDHLDLKHLNLANNKITEFPNSTFSQLTHLETLSLANNEIKLRDGIFFGLNNLLRLDLSNTGLSALNNSHLSGISKSAMVLVEGNQLRTVDSTSFEPPIISETAAEIVRSKKSIENTISPVERGFDVQVCKNNDGALESVFMETNERPGVYCMKEYYGISRPDLRLGGLGLSKVLPGWWQLKGDQFKQIDLSYNHITEITPELLNTLPESLNLIEINANGITMVKRNVINNLHIRILTLDNNAISTIEDGAFENTKLEILVLTGNRLKNVDFAKTLPTSISHLNATANEITEIPENSFTPLKNLRKLALSGNKISHISAGAFGGLTSLFSIDLSYNDLENIEPGTFANLKELFSIVLANNKIQEINSGSSMDLISLNLIDLRNNNIRRISENSFSALKIKPIGEINLSSNKIDTIEEGSFANMILEKLILSHNKISEKSIAKDAFNKSFLHMLYLNSNSITKIDAELFYGISSVDRVLLNDNEIRRINKGAAKYLGNVTDLDFSNNPLEVLGSGALYGLSKKTNVPVSFIGVPLKIIYANAFDEV